MDDRVRRAIDEMASDLRRPVTITMLARRAGLSASRFAHLFTHEVGTSPAQHLKRLKLERARELLETTHHSVKRIASDVGAGDVSHFVRDFARVYDVRVSIKSCGNKMRL